VGLLHRLTAALAALRINISVAQINTESGITNDVFYVTRDGAPLDEATCKALPAQLAVRMNDRTTP
jgi:UTP:GlnB (protein PII) uridylyltransferase